MTGFIIGLIIYLLIGVYISAFKYKHLRFPAAQWLKLDKLRKVWGLYPSLFVAAWPVLMIYKARQ